MFYFVCEHCKHRNTKRYILGVTFVPPLPVPKLTPKVVLVPFSKNNLTVNCHYMNKVETPRCTTGAACTQPSRKLREVRSAQVKAYDDRA